MRGRLLSVFLATVMILSLFAVSGCSDLDLDDIIDDINDLRDSPTSYIEYGETPGPGGTGRDTGSIETRSGRASIVPAAASRVQFENFDNGLVTMEIPRGWQVEVPATADYVHYMFKVFDPKDPDYQLLFFLKLEGFPKTEETRQAWNKLYPGYTSFGKTPAIDPPTTEGFYNIWNELAAAGNEEQDSTYLPVLNGLKIQENMGRLALGGDVLRASFTSGAGRSMQGVLTTTVMDPGPYYMYGYDFAPLHTYHTILILAPDDEFGNWQSVFNRILGSMAFTDAFIKGFNDQENTLVSSIKANQRIYDQTSDMIMDSWEKRSDSYDIISQKRSDATLGYERVYDTETGDVYRAYNGFTDDYQGQRYKAVTDDMYKASITGYIQK